MDYKKMSYISGVIIFFSFLILMPFASLFGAGPTSTRFPASARRISITPRCSMPWRTSAPNF